MKKRKKLNDSEEYALRRNLLDEIIKNEKMPPNKWKNAVAHAFDALNIDMPKDLKSELDKED